VVYNQHKRLQSRHCVNRLAPGTRMRGRQIPLLRNRDMTLFVVDTEQPPLSIDITCVERHITCWSLPQKEGVAVALVASWATDLDSRHAVSYLSCYV
jgi:hypothetical protein